MLFTWDIFIYSLFDQKNTYIAINKKYLKKLTENEKCEHIKHTKDQKGVMQDMEVTSAQSERQEKLRNKNNDDDNNNNNNNNNNKIIIIIIKLIILIKI